MPKVTFTISQDKVNNLAFAFAEDGQLTDAELESLVSVAFEEWADTLLGTTRFRSITELYVNWLRDIFQRLLTDEDPDEKMLITRLNLPYGQAAYIARVLREENPVSSRKRWLNRLETALKNRLPEAKEWIKEGRGEIGMEFHLHKYARRELSIILGRMLDAGIATRQVKITSTVADYIFVLIASAEIEKILNEIAKEKARIRS